MRRDNRLILAAAVAFLLGCGSEPSKADDQKGEEKPAPVDKAPDKKDERPAAAAKKDEKKGKRFLGTVTDRLPDVKPFTIEEAKIFTPQVSIFGGDSGLEETTLRVKHGAAEIEVPFEDVTEVTFGNVKDDRLEVVVAFREKAGVLEGTVKANLQLRGTYVMADPSAPKKQELKAQLKLREIKSVKLEEIKEGK